MKFIENVVLLQIEDILTDRSERSKSEDAMVSLIWGTIHHRIEGFQS